MGMRACMRCAALVGVLWAGALAGAEDEPRLHEGRDAASWAADLASGDLDTRRKAAFALWQVGTDARPHVRTVASALRDEDEYVRGTIEKVLIRFEWQRSIDTLASALPELIAALGDERASVRLAAVNLIWNAGPIPNVVGGAPPPKELVPALQEALADEDARIRANAAASLANLQKSAAAALPALRKALGDADPQVRMWTVRALSWIDAVGTLPSILALSGDADEGVRTAVFEATGSASADQWDAVFAKLKAGLRDEAQPVRSAAVNALSFLGRVAALPELARVLEEDPDPGVRGLAAMALGALGDPAAVPYLTAALAGEDETVLAGAVSGLARLGPEGAVGLPRMIELLETGSPALRQGIAGALYPLGPFAEPALPALVKALAHEDAGVRSMAASSLSGLASYGLQSEALRTAVVAGLEDGAPNVRQYCVSIIASLGPQMGAAVAGLLAVHARGDEQVGATPVFHALQRIGTAAKQALPVLRKAASNEGFDRAAAAAALACVSEDREEIDGAVQVLIDALKDEQQRAAAFYRLKLVGPRAARAAPILRVWMKADSPWRLQAASALVRLEGAKAADAAGVLAAALASEDAGSAMRAVADLGPEGRALVPALLAHAQDPASQWRTGALAALLAMEARGSEVRAAYAAARHDANAWLRTQGARGLAALDAAEPPR